MKKYVILLNGGCWFENNKNVFSEKECREIVKDRWDDIYDEEGDKLDFEMLIGDDMMKVFGGDCEYGDDYVDLCIMELVEG